MLSAFPSTPNQYPLLSWAPAHSTHTRSLLASFRKPFLINPGGTPAKPIAPERLGGRGEVEADFEEHRYPEGRAAPPSFPSRTARKVRQRLGDTAVLGSGGSYTVGGGTSRPREAQGLCTQRAAPAPAGPPGAQSAGVRSGDLRQRGWKGAGSGSRPGPLKCWRYERRAPRQRTGAKTVNK